MPEENGDFGERAGISLTGERGVAAVFARLQEEIRKSSPSRLDGPAASPRSTAREEAERVWPVTFDHPVVRRPGSKGALLHPVKRTLRRLIRWYVEPFAVDQRGFNESALKLVDGLHERIDGVRQSVAALQGEAQERARLERLVHEAEERLLRLERRGGGSAGTVAAQPRAAAVPDYFRFETRMRGSFAEIRERQRPYVPEYVGAAPVLDLGCGRGEFLALLREAGIESRGVDADADMVAFARGEGLEVAQADALAHLEALKDDSLGGIFAAQLVEHLPPPSLLRLLELAVQKLRPGGLFVAETINPLSPLSLRHYFADLTHAQPLVPETLALLAQQAGFASVDVRYLNEPPAGERLTPVELPDDPAFAAARKALGENVERLNEVLFAPLDYAILARAPA